MKQLLAITFLSATILMACGSDDEKATTQEVKPLAPVEQGKNTTAFNNSFKEVVDAYFHLKDNFITESVTLIDFYAVKMQKATDSLKLNELQGDAAIKDNATSFAQSISSELIGLSKEKDLLNKRKAFNMVSEQLYNLIRIVKYNGQVIYHQHSNTAFADGDTNGYWLSATPDIKNPYTPLKLTTGTLLDSLDYTK